MIKIFMYQEKFRIKIGGSGEEECFEFETRKKMEEALKFLLDLKETNGKLNDKSERWDK